MRILIQIYPEAQDDKDLVNMSYQDIVSSFDDAVASVGRLERVCQKDKEAAQKLYGAPIDF